MRVTDGAEIIEAISMFRRGRRVHSRGPGTCCWTCRCRFFYLVQVWHVDVELVGVDVLDVGLPVDGALYATMQVSHRW